jgi:hypothetical protein
MDDARSPPRRGATPRAKPSIYRARHFRAKIARGVVLCVVYWAAAGARARRTSRARRRARRDARCARRRRDARDDARERDARDDDATRVDDDARDLDAKNHATRTSIARTSMTKTFTLGY